MSLYTESQIRREIESAGAQVRICAEQARSFAAWFAGTQAGWKSNALAWRNVWKAWRSLQRTRGFR